MNALISKILCKLLSISWIFFSFFCSLISKRLRKDIKLREIKSNELEALKNMRKSFNSAVIFFCSSAGEYEQALPIIKRLRKHKNNILIYILFFSYSGYIFAKKRHEKLPMRLYYGESLKDNKNFFISLRPTCTIVIRHELWPVFLKTAAQYSKLILVNYSEKIIQNLLLKKLKKYLLCHFDFIFAISNEQEKKLHNSYHINTQSTSTAKDTKYDQVFERKEESKTLVKQLDELFLKIKKRLIIAVGSAWSEDVEINLASLKKIKETQDISPIVFIVHHKPSQKHLSLTSDHCKRHNLTYQVMGSGINSWKINNLESIDVIIIEKMGILFELYGISNFAFVGGAMHHKVHNVLEPLANNIPIAFGPYYKNSLEAVSLVENKTAVVVNSIPSYTKWINSNIAKSKTSKASYTSKLIGGSDHVASYIVTCIDLHQNNQKYP